MVFSLSEAAAVTGRDSLPSNSDLKGKPFRFPDIHPMGNLQLPKVLFLLASASESSKELLRTPQQKLNRIHPND